MKTQISDVHVSYTARGLPRFEVEVSHSGLNKFQKFKSADQYEAISKAKAKAASWNEAWSKKKAAMDKKELIAANKQEAAALTETATVQITIIENVLVHTLSIDDKLDFNTLLNTSPYPKPKPIAEKHPNRPEARPKPDKPKPEHFRTKRGVLDKFSRKRQARKEEAEAEAYEKAVRGWQNTCDEIDSSIEALTKKYEEVCTYMDVEHAKKARKWEEAKAKYERKQEKENARIEAKKKEYLAKSKDGVEFYCGEVLNRSEYPSRFPRTFDIDYDPETRILICDYQLPSKETLPTLVQVTYVQSRDEFTEKHLSATKVTQMYDRLLYEIALRTVHELFESDRVAALASVVFNGYVSFIDKATGKEQTSCIMSLHTTPDEFNDINLKLVEPKTCFKSLKGVGSSKLSSLTPIAPLIQMNKSDARFVSSHDVADSIDEGYNLATMDWEEFEHLVREVFGKEFSANGGEVKVTQASRDGGVDAVAFDPDPIRGGKTVIQAKRYTNTVGVSAVRDLYGTVVNEGAIKGILVTTSDYGPDAHQFAAGKPITLLSGAHLLHLLEKHGHRARIDLKEAKEYFREQAK